MFLIPVVQFLSFKIHRGSKIFAFIIIDLLILRHLFISLLTYVVILGPLSHTFSSYFHLDFEIVNFKLKCCHFNSFFFNVFPLNMVKGSDAVAVRRDTV